MSLPAGRIFCVITNPLISAVLGAGIFGEKNLKCSWSFSALITALCLCLPSSGKAAGGNCASGTAARYQKPRPNPRNPLNCLKKKTKNNNYHSMFRRAANLERSKQKAGGRLAHGEHDKNKPKSREEEHRAGLPTGNQKSQTIGRPKNTVLRRQEW